LRVIYPYQRKILFSSSLFLQSVIIFIARSISPIKNNKHEDVAPSDKTLDETPTNKNINVEKRKKRKSMMKGELLFERDQTKF